MFTQVYGPASKQEDVFKDTKSLMTSVLDGYNVCIFAYGQSGTGKTFTMNGNDELPGLVPRAMIAIFENVGEREINYKHDCFLSMIEIYNETSATCATRRPTSPRSSTTSCGTAWSACT